MYPLLLLLAFLILLQAGFFLIGMAQLNMLGKQIPSAIAAGLLSTGAVLSMMFANWELLVLSFVLYQAWTTIESLLLQGRISASSLVLAPVNLITIAGCMVAFFSGQWIVFGVTYFFHWTLTLVIGKRLMARYESK